MESVIIKHGDVFDIYFPDQHQQGTPGNPPKLVVLQMVEYKSQFILAGFKPTHQQHIYRVGFEDVPGSPAVGVILPWATKETVNFMTKAFGGTNIELRQHDRTIPLCNWASSLGGLWRRKDYFDMEERMKRGVTFIDVYLHWKEKGELPSWFRLAKAGQLVLSS